ncbi:hypothetical protein PsorP6_011012 [Peronosclerospora sorghi]|uniref:Uncharacterized protein n=1 Tax=Peronosclerospora sorghi TaxID=230839 RepID=A0ACC0VX54_9STRA|nr:hypothetical protein PsorP6_011012 [Peronosclerospora sorghi]
MRPASLLLLYALASSCTPQAHAHGLGVVPFIQSNPARLTRVLRARHVGTESFEEERAGGSLDRINTLVRNTFKDLSDEAVNAIAIVHKRALESAHSKGNLYVKERGKPRAPEAYRLTQDVERANQAKRGDIKLTAGGVIYRKDGNKYEYLLIGSSNSEKLKFLLPRGGQLINEEEAHAAMREMIEEAGVLVKLEHRLKDAHQENSIFQPFVAQVALEYNDYAENARRRVWVSEADARKMLLKGNEEMLPVFEEGVKKIKASSSPNPDLVKKKLPHLDPADLEALAAI